MKVSNEIFIFVFFWKCLYGSYDVDVNDFVSFSLMVDAPPVTHGSCLAFLPGVHLLFYIPVILLLIMYLMYIFLRCLYIYVCLYMLSNC